MNRHEKWGEVIDKLETISRNLKSEGQDVEGVDEILQMTRRIAQLEDELHELWLREVASGFEVE